MRNCRAMILASIIFLFTGCGQKEVNRDVQNATVNKVESQPAAVEGFQTFGIYTDRGTKGNHFIPSGFMPDGQCLTLDEGWLEGCHNGSSCIKVVYDIECSKNGQKWAGIYWLNPANNWGSRKGGFNLDGAKELTFWAKGEKGGERIEEFKVGGIAGDFPDSDMAVIGPVILTAEWRKYSIDLRGKDLSYISGGFSWATNVDVNPQECTFYLDDLQFE